MAETSLSDMQLILLSTAHQRDDGQLLPAAATIAGQKAKVTEGLKDLLELGLVAEAATTVRQQCWREEKGV